MTDNDRDKAVPDTGLVAPEPLPEPTVSGMMIATGDLAVTPGTDSDQETREDQ